MNEAKPELLAPAGDWESLCAAARFGADAVYIGGETLQLRADKSSFSRENIVKAAEYLHSVNKRLYIAVNSFAKNSEIKDVSEYGGFLYDAGADAVIVSDIGVMSELHRAVPNLPIHVSTQANCMNYAAANVYQSLGASRVVLAREITMSEISELHRELGGSMEIEAFVHGAMCMAYSGRCLLSSYLAGRSGNRGECAQPCRWNYSLVEEKRSGEYYDVSETDGFSAILSSRDLCCVGILDKLRDSGAVSFKIEGRMKTAYYVASVVNAYRRVIDGTADIPTAMRELEAVKHRPYTTGFYLGELPEQHNNSGKYEHTCVFAGNVLDYISGTAIVRQRGKFSVGDTLEIVSPESIGESFVVENIENENGESVSSAPHPMEVVKVECPVEVKAGDFLRKRETI